METRCARALNKFALARLQREGVELDSCLSSRLPLNPTLFWSEKIPAIYWTTPSMLLGQRIG